MYRYVLFDLDGTLTDPKEGICKSVQHAMEKAGLEVPEVDRLTSFIGPPLKDSFREFCHMDERQAQQAVEDYRERFSEVGWKENIPYPGVDVLLSHCRLRGVKLAVASSKPQVFVEKILQHFGLRKYFDVVVGSELDGTRSKKEEVVKEALQRLYAKRRRSDAAVSDAARREQTAMVGDRKFDIEGARSEGVDAIAVAYGYAAKGELAGAGADAIAGSVEELEELLLGGKRGRAENDVRIKPVPERSFAKAIYMVAPFAAYFLLYEVLHLLGYSILEVLTGISQQELQNMLQSTVSEERSAAVLVHVWVTVMIHAGTVIALCLFYKGWEPLQWKRKVSMEWGRGFLRNLQIAGTGIFLSLGLNILLSKLVSFLAPLFLNEQQVEELFRKAGYESMTPLLSGTLLFVFITPLLEELVFRWLLLNRISRVFPAWIAAVITALFFGFYHGNLMQGVYAFLMGLVMAQLCLGEECVSVSYIFHLSANAVIFWGAFLPGAVSEPLTKPYMGILYLGIGGLFYKILSKSMTNFCAKRQ